MCVSLGINLCGYNYNIWKDIDHQRRFKWRYVPGANVAYDMNVIVYYLYVVNFGGRDHFIYKLKTFSSA